LGELDLKGYIEKPLRFVSRCDTSGVFNTAEIFDNRRLALAFGQEWRPCRHCRLESVRGALRLDLLEIVIWKSGDMQRSYYFFATELAKAFKLISAREFFNTAELHQVLPFLSRRQVQNLLMELRLENRVHVEGKTSSSIWFPG